MIQRFKKNMMEEHKMSDMDILKHFLGMKITQ